MSEKSNLYVSKVISNQLGHNPELTTTPFKNTVSSTDDLFEDLGATETDLGEIAVRIDEELGGLESHDYINILEATKVSEIEKVVESMKIEDSKFDALLKAFEPPKEEKKEEATAPAAAVPAQA